jgi:hypothetical protein
VGKVEVLLSNLMHAPPGQRTDSDFPFDPDGATVDSVRQHVLAEYKALERGGIEAAFGGSTEGQP